MDILVYFKILSFILSFSLVLFALKTIAVPQARTFFILMIVCFFVSTILFFPEGRINDWLKHLPFFLGQLFLFFFLSTLLNIYSRPPAASNPQSSPPPIALGAMAVTNEWFTFLTDQGLQHFLAVPLFLIIMTSIQVHYPQIKSVVFRSILTLCLAAGACLTMIHLGEFIVESQMWLPFLAGEPIEIIEFLWYYAACVIFFITLKKISVLHTQIGLEQEGAL